MTHFPIARRLVLHGVVILFLILSSSVLTLVGIPIVGWIAWMDLRNWSRRHRGH